MDENVANPDTSQDTDDKSEEPIKRFKTNDASFGRSEESSSSSSTTTDQDTPSTSTEAQNGSGDSEGRTPPVTFRLSPNSKNRNYRNSRENNDDSEDRDDPMGEEEQAAEPSPEAPAEGEDDDNDWEDYEDEDEDEEDFGDFYTDSVSSDDSTVVVDPAEAEIDIKDHPLLNKEKPKHTWFAINEIDKRQLGYSAKLQSRELFQRRCYGSLHCVQRLELMYKLEEHQGCVNSLNFHHDGTLLASGADDLKVVVWDWKIGKMLTKYKTRHRGNVFQSKFLHLSGDLHIASCARDGQVRLAQLNSDEGVRNSRMLGFHKGPCHKLIVLPEQPHIILSAGEDGVVLSHDVRGPKSSKIVNVKEGGKTIALYSIHGHPLKTQEFCVSGRDAIVRVYDQRKSSKLLASYTPFKKAKAKSNRNYHVTCAVYNYNGAEILASYSDADIYLFDVNEPEQGKFIHQYQGHRNGATIKGVNFFGPKSEFVVSGSDCGHIYFWEKNTEALCQWLLADDNGVVNCLEPHPQLPFICTSGLDWDVKVWVPSCEEEPTMDGLNNTLKNNLKKKMSITDPSDINESQMLWMLWRHLRNTSRMRILASHPLPQPYSDSNSSGSESLSNSDGSDDDLDRAPNCNTS